MRSPVRFLLRMSVAQWQHRTMHTLSRALLVTLAALASTTAGCSSDSSPASPAPTSGVPEGCDPLVPSYCGFPFPSNAHLANDPSTPTGKRVNFTSKMLPRWQHGGRPTAADPWNDADGFSSGMNIMTHIPNASITGLPTQDTLDSSLKTDSPTLLIEADTGALVPHFAELDMTPTTRDEERTFLIRPVVRLKDATRYIVAIRHVVDEAGASIPATAAFQALRDGTPFGDAEIENRRGNYADIFAKLKTAGIDKGDLQIAWDFTTSSRDNNTRWMIHMRDDALKTVGDQGPEYKIDSVETAPNTHIAKRIRGHMTVPLYLDTGAENGTLVFGDDGMPKQNGTYDFPFVVHVPNSLTDGSSGPLLQNGHGLLGSMDEGQNGYLATIADTKKMIAFSMDLTGMASGDNDMLLNAITSDLGDFKKIVGRQHQGLINELLLMRMMKGRFVNEPEVQFNGKSAIDPTATYYRGDSQGGIFGTTYMAISTDVTRGLLGEPGGPYSMILSRSKDFGPFFTILYSSYKSAMDLSMSIGLIQMLWDRTEPNGYMPYIHENMLPGTPSHDVLLHAALGDQQVSPLGAHIIARAIGAKNLKAVNREVWGLEDTDAPYTGSAIVEVSFGLPEVPKTNTPPGYGGVADPHDWVRELPETIDMADVFFRTGQVTQTCNAGKGPCIFPQPND